MDVVFAILILIVFILLWRSAGKVARWQHRRALEMQAETALRNEMNWAAAQQRAADKLLREAGESP